MLNQPDGMMLALILIVFWLLYLTWRQNTMADDINEINADVADGGAKLTALEAIVPQVVALIKTESDTVASLQAQLAAASTISPEAAATLHTELVAANARLAAATVALSALLPPPVAPVAPVAPPASV